MINPLVAHTNSFHPYPLEVALAGVCDAGYRYVELAAVRGWTDHVDVEEDPAPTLKQLDELGLQAVALSGHSDLTTAEGVDLAVLAIESAAAAGLTLVTTAIGGHASIDEDIDLFLSGIGTIADAAAQSGVVVALEVHGELMSTGLQSMAIIQQIDREQIRVKYDTGNVEYYGGVKAVDDVHHVLTHLVNVDAKDKLGGQGVWDFPPPGVGSIDWPRFIKILANGGYRGPITVEVEFQGDPWPSPAEVTEALITARDTLAPLLPGSSEQARQ